MLKKSLRPQDHARLSVKAKLVHLTLNTKWFAPLFCALCFGLFSGVTLLLGLSANISQPPMVDLPLYPGAQAIVNADGQAVSVLDTSTLTKTQTSVSYSFATVDPPDRVASFYLGTLEKTYGFIDPSVEVAADGSYTVHGLRTAFRNGRVVENVTVNIVPVSTLLTQVALGLMVRW